MTESIALRRLNGDDWAAMRTLRLVALRTEPGVFSSTYAHEREYDKELWRERLDATTAATFGLFAGD